MNTLGTAALRLEVEILRQPITMDRPCPIWITLWNEGDEPLWVNSRMAVGYRDNVSRELYAELSDAATGLPARVYEVDYDRPYAAPEDYALLEAGGSLCASFDLWQWYRLAEPGRYRLVFYYQADEQPAPAPAEVTPGRYASEPLMLDVLRGREGEGDAPASLG